MKRTPTATPSPAALRVGGTFRFGVPGAIANWNIDTAAGQQPAAMAVLQQVDPSVFIAGPGPGTLTLNTSLVTAARVIRRSPQVVRYDINRHALWSDGVPVTARDFGYVWQVSNGRACRGCQAATANGYDDVRSVRGSRHGRIVMVRFRRPFGDWRLLFGGGAGLLPAHVAARHGGLLASFRYFSNHPPTVSAGPFTLARFSSGIATLRRNPRYAGAPPTVDQLSVTTGQDSSHLIEAVRTGQLDATQLSPSLAVLAALRTAGVRAAGVSDQIAAGVTEAELIVNERRAPLTDRALRLALLTAVNRQQLLVHVASANESGAALLDNRFLVPGEPGYRDDISSTRLGTGDLQHAEATLTGASYRGVGTTLYSPGGRRVRPLTFGYNPAVADAQPIASLAAAAIRQLGVQVNLVATTQPQREDLAIQIINRPLAAASTTARRFLSSSPDNVGGYRNPQLDHYLRQAVAADTPGSQAAAADIADLLISQDADTLPLFQQPVITASARTAVGVTPNATVQGPAYDAARWALRRP